VTSCGAQQPGPGAERPKSARRRLKAHSDADTPPSALPHDTSPVTPTDKHEPSSAPADGAERELERLRASLRVIQVQNATLRQLVAIHDRLGGLVLQGADVAAITSLLSDLVGRRVLLLDTLLAPVAVSAGHDAAPSDAAAIWSPSEAYINRVLSTLTDDRRPLRLPAVGALGVEVGCVVTPVVMGDAILGYLVILENGPGVRDDGADGGGGNDGELNVLVVQHAATVYALAMMRERMAAEVTRQLRNELLEGLLLGHLSDPEEIGRRAARVGFRPGRPHQVIVLSPEDLAAPLPDPAADARRAAVRRQRLLDGLAELLGSRATDAIVSPRHDELVAIVPMSEDGRLSLKDLGRAAIAHAATLFSAWSLTVGIGGTCQQPGEIAGSYAQARRAVDAAQRFGRQGQVVAFEDLGLYRLLFQVANPAELDGFVDQVLGELIAYDARHQADFVLTLASFLRNNASPQATARELAVHVNTVSYRLQRIRTVSGLNLDDAEDRLLAGVALKIIAGTAPRG
jgi:sugar diacid utilization regulator